jgi:hypothetical protein
MIVIPSHPPNKTFRADPTKAPSSTGKHRSPDENVRRMEMEADTLRHSSFCSCDAIPGGDSLLPLAPRETLKIEQNVAMPGEDLYMPPHCGGHLCPHKASV